MKIITIWYNSIKIFLVIQKIKERKEKNIMETKDWILLLIPILCNGVIIFSFQAVMSRRQKITDVRNETVFDSIRALSIMVCDQRNKMMHLMRECSYSVIPPEEAKPAPIDKLWDPIAEKTIEICDYYTNHEVMFRERGIQIDDYIGAYEQICNIFSKKINILWSDADKQEIFMGLSAFENSMIKLNEQLERVLIFKS